MSDDDILIALADACQGSLCVVERRDNDWVINFGKGQFRLATIWRIVADGRIALGSEDDQHEFGFPQRIDGEARANELLGGRQITAIEIDRGTSDIRLSFAGEVRLDVFNQSSGYEGWDARFDGERVIIIGKGHGVVIV